PKSGSPSARTAPRPWKWSRSPPRRQAPGRNVVDSLVYVNDLVHDLFDRVAVGAAVLHARPGGWLAAPRRPLHPTRFTALTPLRVRPAAEPFLETHPAEARLAQRHERALLDPARAPTPACRRSTSRCGAGAR